MYFKSVAKLAQNSLTKRLNVILLNVHIDDHLSERGRHRRQFKGGQVVDLSSNDGVQMDPYFPFIKVHVNAHTICL